MTDIEPPPTEAPVPQPDPPYQPPPYQAPAYRPDAPATETSPWVWVLCVVVLLLAGGEFWLWRHAPSSDGASPAEFAAIGEQLQGLAGRVAALEQHPPAATDLHPLEARIAALEQRPSAVSATVAPAVDLGPLEARIAAVEQKPAPAPVDLAPLAARIAAVEQKPAPAPVDLGPLDARLAALEHKPVPPPEVTSADLARLGGRLDEVGTQSSALDAKQAARVQALEARVAADEAHAQQLPALIDRAQHIARLDAARQALEEGRPLGTLDGAPPALARYASAAPPTQPALQLAFDSAARDALAASQPSAAPDAPLLDRAWARAQGLLTVRQGDQVIVGDPASGIIARARQALQAGDLPAAVADLSKLDGAAAQAMAGWVGQAQALLDARAALSSLAEHA